MKSKIIILLSLFFITIINKSNNDYGRALGEILNSEEYLSITKNKKKYKVSNEVIVFEKMGKLFLDELKQNNINLSIEEIVSKEQTENLHDEILLELNKKKCAKVQIFFSEIKDNIFFAEIIKSKKNNSYENRINYGSSSIFMFKVLNDNIELLAIKEIIYG